MHNVIIPCLENLNYEDLQTCPDPLVSAFKDPISLKGDYFNIEGDQTIDFVQTNKEIHVKINAKKITSLTDEDFIGVVEDQTKE